MYNWRNYILGEISLLHYIQLYPAVVENLRKVQKQFTTPCADSGFFQGRGVQAGPSARKQSGQLFLVLNLCYSLQRGSNGFIAEKAITIQRIQRGSNIFQGGGVQMLISI